MNWQIGDRAIAIRPGSRIYGYEVVITGELQITISSIPELNGTLAYAIDPGIPPNAPHTYWVARPQYLKPIPDDKSTWSELEKTLKWNPTKLVTVETGEKT